jgi:hypothetical protein
MSEMKLIMEGWDKFLNEDADSPTVSEFLTIFAKQHPRSLGNILKLGARKIASIGTGILVGTAAGTATGGLGGVVAGAAATKITEEALNQIFGAVAQHSGELARFMVQMAQGQVDDSSRAGIDNYYDIDDEYEELIGGMESDLGKKYTKELFDFYKRAFEGVDEAEDGDKPLSDFLALTANDYFRRYVKNKSKSGVGVAVKKVG